MSKRHILYHKSNGRRSGGMNYRKKGYLMLDIGFQGLEELEADIIAVLNKHFNIKDLSEVSNSRKRGCVGRAFGQQKKR